MDLQPDDPIAFLTETLNELQSLFQSINDFNALSTERIPYKLKLIDWCDTGTTLYSRLTMFLSQEFVTQDEETEKSLEDLLYRIETNREELREWMLFFQDQLIEFSDELKN